ncbi:Thiol-disulfide isomerase or thioredoxin [Pustulibacterium marinum]|uniref:Thiol-disulfide isomerase or thioredoxin n=1 Tax=Pustulibacterium marinum TaxID=1224947 RepID=A0A1I7FVE4_9FLAO|nr:thioredoxin family protein [Pustulibacterium marinum]SFU40194.1 Thiol-disulfide isomerase or thioredoxin [Pustulibacterium marinum]
MKGIAYILLCCILFSCGSKAGLITNEDATTVNPVADPDLVGPIKRATLEDDYNWFDEEYTSYKVDETAAKTIKPYLEDVTVKIFMGTWCHDSQQQVPHFFKIMDQINFKAVEVYGLTTDKTSPEGLEDQYNIINVPTFIFFKDGEEINRMVEYPLNTLEKDMVAIFTTDTYENPYAGF